MYRTYPKTMDGARARHTITPPFPSCIQDASIGIATRWRCILFCGLRIGDAASAKPDSKGFSAGGCRDPSVFRFARRSDDPLPPRAPSRYCRDATVYGPTTTAMHDNNYPTWE